MLFKVYSRHLYVRNLGEVHRNLGANKIKDIFLVLKLLFDVHLQSKEVYPNIIEDTEVNIKALVEAVILTEQVQAKVGVAGRHHHRCRRRHRRLVVQHSCFPCFLGGINCWSKTNICNSTLSEYMLITCIPVRLNGCPVYQVLSTRLLGTHCKNIILLCKVLSII